MNLKRDKRIIFTAAGLRAVAISFSSVILPLHLSRLGWPSSRIALFISIGLAGCAAGTFTGTFVADRVGRRKALAVSAALMSIGGLAMAFSTGFGTLLVSAFFGMMNGMGRDRGLSLTVDQAVIPQLSAAGNRTTTFAWYNLVVDVGNALGALAAFFPSLCRRWGATHYTSYRLSWLLYSLLCFSGVFLILRLSAAVEIKNVKAKRLLSPSSRPIVIKFSMLSAMDSLGGGFLTTALLSYWFFKRFGVDEAFLGPLFFFVRLANGLSHLGAAWIAKRIGLVNTMVFTHLPSSFLLMTVPFMPNLATATLFFLLRELLVEMDVPTRQSYIVAVVREEERTIAAGITNLTRSVAWALGPLIAAPLIGTVALSAPFFIGPGLKVAYDILLFRAFRHIKPPEET